VITEDRRVSKSEGPVAIVTFAAIANPALSVSKAGLKGWGPGSIFNGGPL